MIYAVTGSSGFIGKALVSRLKQDGHIVNIINRKQLYDVGELFRWFVSNNIDGIFHLAAYGNHYNQKDYKEVFRVNILHTMNLFKAAEGRKVYNFSSSSVELPVQTVYSISKTAGEQLALLFPNIVNIRPYSVYGPGEAPHRFIPTICRSLLNMNTMQVDEQACHDWIYINDFINALLAGHPEIGTGKSYSNLQIIQLMESVTGKRLNYDKVEKMRDYDSTEWKCKNPVPHIGIVEGLKLTWEYYNK
jgi:nucleoside-diphosphate-sugar epimerase